MPLTLEQFGINSLSSSERLELVELIWNSIDDDAPVTPTEWHRQELDRRIAAADADPGAVEPWETVMARLSSQQ